MQLEVDIIDKPEDHMTSHVPFKAFSLRPLSQATYQATVIRSPTPSGSLFRVALDITLEVVHISPASYLALKLSEPLRDGDPCVVRLAWKEMIDASAAKRPPVGEIVSAHRMHFVQAEVTEELATVQTRVNSAPPAMKPLRAPQSDKHFVTRDDIAMAKEVGNDLVASSPSSSCCSCEDGCCEPANGLPVPFERLDYSVPGYAGYCCPTSRPAAPCGCQRCSFYAMTTSGQSWAQPRFPRSASMPSFDKFGDFNYQ